MPLTCPFLGHWINQEQTVAAVDVGWLWTVVVGIVQPQRLTAATSKAVGGRC